MNLLVDSEPEQPVMATFLALPFFDNALRNGPDCVLKTCCKKYKKSKRCKSCPKK